MKDRLLRFMRVQPGETGRVGLLFIMGIFMGVFIATMSVASQALFLEHFDEGRDLPFALLYSGLFGLAATIAYNYLQNRIPFPLLSALSLLAIVAVTAFIEFGEGFFPDPATMYMFGFTQILPFTFIINLVFWGSFSRLFNLRQARRLVGTVDVGAMLVTIAAFFSIPYMMDRFGIEPVTLYSISLVCIAIFLVLSLFLGLVHLNKTISFAQEKSMFRKLKVADFVKNRYIMYMSLVVIFSVVTMTFIDFSFLNVADTYFKKSPEQLATFVAYFEGTIVIFSFLVDVLAVERVNSDYGMRISLLINPVVLLLATGAALASGVFFGYSAEDNLFFLFFVGIALSKLFTSALQDSMDDHTFRLYLLPISGDIRVDVQTKVTGIVNSMATVIAAGLIILITQIGFDLLYVTIFTIPFILLWFVAINKMHKNYRHTLEKTLEVNKKKSQSAVTKEYTITSVLEKEVRSSTEEKIIYGLKLMEKLEPALFENAIIPLADSDNAKLRRFAEEKIAALGIEKPDARTDIRHLAEQALGESHDSDLMSISVDKLMKLSKSIKQNDRILAAKLLRKLTSQRTIFILLELLRDVDPRVRFEALLTARRVKRPETWPVLIEMLSSPSYGHHAAAALKESGEVVLPTLDAAFHKSGQTDLVMLRIVQIIGRIGGDEALKILWRKADFPDKRIVRQILYSLRYINYRAEGREAREVFELLDTEIAKAIWNMAALSELSEREPHFTFLREALKEEVEHNFDQITILLSIIYDPESIQLVRENIESGDPDNLAFAMELLHLFVDQELKPKLFPLLDDSPTDQKLELLQLYYPRETYTPIQVINYILNRDFNQNNRWTKACAIHAAAFIADFRISRGLIAQVFNNDRLLQETAAWVIYNKDKKSYAAIRERLPARDKKFIDSSIENNQLLEGLDDGFFLGIEMVMFLKQVPVFQGIPGTLLSDLSDKITPIELNLGEQYTFRTDEVNSPIFIVAHGEVKLKNNDHVVHYLRRGDLYGDLFQDGPAPDADNVEATQKSVLFRINLVDFYFVMANHHELVQGLIKNITENKLQPAGT